jgi:uncharacterized protein
MTRDGILAIVELLLDPVEVRVLGALIEKEATTPEYYPLTLNALVAACNQKNNRDPVVNYDEETVAEALLNLRRQHLAMETSGRGMRVPKYAQRLSEALNLGRRELALLGTLMLRGRQTVGELRDRAGRMHEFSDLEEAAACLDRMSELEQPLARRLERQPGEKEPRYTHLLSGAVDESAPAAVAARTAVPVGGSASRLAELEAEMARLRGEVDSLKSQMADLRRQLGIE